MKKKDQNEQKLKTYRKKLAEKIERLIQQWLYFIEDDNDEKRIVKFWKFLDKYTDNK